MIKNSILNYLPQYIHIPYDFTHVHYYNYGQLFNFNLLKYLKPKNKIKFYKENKILSF